MVVELRYRRPTGETTPMDRGKWTGVLEVVGNPLKFFALALLVVDGAIGAIAGLALEGAAQLQAVWIMAGLFLVVVGIVAVITFWRPENLYEKVRDLEDIINSKGFRDAIEEVVDERLDQGGG